MNKQALTRSAATEAEQSGLPIPASSDTRVSGVSVVIPIYNEVENIPHLYAEMTDAMKGLERDYEIIFVDDGSTDGSTDALRAIANDDQHVHLVLFRRNYGQTAALQAGVDHATMDVVVTIDGDLQNDPADIKPMIEKLEEGYDLVHGWRRDRQDALVSRKIPSRIANRLISSVTQFPIHDLGCTLKAIRRDILSEIKLYGDMHRFIPILLYQRGARCAEMVTRHRPRVAGTTKYGIGRTITVLLDLVTVKFLLDYSAHPMRLFGGLGLISLGVAFVAIFLTVAMKLFGDVNMTGNPFLLLTVLATLAGFQFLCIGILGEVIARIYYGRQSRTHYAVRERVNMPEAGRSVGI